MSIDTAPDRRRPSPPPAPEWGELLVESSWRPQDRPGVDSVGWMIAHGYLPERRQARTSPHQSTR